MDLALLPRLCEEAVGKVRAGQFNTQEITNVLNAIAKLGYGQQAEVLVSALCEQARAKADEFNTQEAAVILNALAKMPRDDKALIVPLCTRLSLATDLNYQDIANALNALAKFDHFDRVLVERLCEEALYKAA